MEGEKKGSVHSFVYVFMFVHVNSTTFEHSSSIYRVKLRITNFIYCIV